MVKRRYEPQYKGSRTELLSWDELVDIFKLLFGEDIDTLPNFPTAKGHTEVMWRDRELQVVEAEVFDEARIAYADCETSLLQVGSFGRPPFNQLTFTYTPARNEGFLEARTSDKDAAERALAIMRSKFPAAMPTGDLDQGFLAGVRERYGELQGSTVTPQRRGQLFDGLVCDTLRGHGCDAETGRKANGEQNDVFVFKPFHLLVECKWEATRTEPSAIRDLQSKLLERHAAVMGLFVSIAGYTDEALRTAADTRDRVLVCATQSDYESWVEGQLWFRRWWDDNVDRLVKRYDAR